MQNIKKPILIATENLGWFETITDQVGSNIEIISIKKIEDMEPKIKSPKELKIKAVESEEQIASAEANDDGGLKKERKTTGNVTAGLIPPTKKQKKARAANKTARKARKINRK